MLRTPATIVRFQKIPVEHNSPQPIFQYLSTLLKTERLNERESIELEKTILQHCRPQLMEKWLKDDKFQCCEKLGDLIMPSDAGMPLTVYLRSEYHSKTINDFVQYRKYDKIVPYASSVGLKIDYSLMLSQ